MTEVHHDVRSGYDDIFPRPCEDASVASSCATEGDLKITKWFWKSNTGRYAYRLVQLQGHTYAFSA